MALELVTRVWDVLYAERTRETDPKSGNEDAYAHTHALLSPTPFVVRAAQAAVHVIIPNLR